MSHPMPLPALRSSAVDTPASELSLAGAALVAGAERYDMADQLQLAAGVAVARRLGGARA